MNHGSPGLGNIHPIKNWEYADAAARTGATGFTADDVGKFAKQTDNGTYWELTAVTPTWVQLGPSVITVEFAIGTQSGTNITVTAQVKKDGANVTEQIGLFAWLSDTSKGEVGSAPSGGVTVGDSAGFSIIEHTANLVWHISTNGSGLVSFGISNTGAATFYLNIILPDGSIAASNAITFT